jgi:hypothetical protein
MFRYAYIEGILRWIWYFILKVDLLAWSPHYIRTSRLLTNTNTKLHPYIQAAPTHYGCEKGVRQERWVDGRGNSSLFLFLSLSLSTPIYTPCPPSLPIPRYCSRTHAISPSLTLAVQGQTFLGAPHLPFPSNPRKTGTTLRGSVPWEGVEWRGKSSSLPAMGLSNILNPLQWWKLK